MTPDEIIKMARQAGLDDEVLVPWSFEIQAFAKLVAAKEREACAKVCEEFVLGSPFAAAIRARGSK